MVRLVGLALLLALVPLAVHAAPARDTGCPGGRYVITVEAVQHQNWIQASPIVSSPHS